MGELTKKFEQIIENSAPLRLEQILELEIETWLNSDKRALMLQGEEYYLGRQDILDHTRLAIGRDGKAIKVSNIPNAQQVDNQYAVHLDKKVNYSLGKPITLVCENRDYLKVLRPYFGADFMRLLRKIGYEAIEGGVAYVHPYYNEQGAFRLKVLDNKDVIPFYSDEDRTDLQGYIRLYEEIVYEAREEKRLHLCDFVTQDGVRRYERKEGKLHIRDRLGHLRDVKGKPYNWERIPLVPFRYNDREIPMISRVKSLQDGINLILSTFQNHMLEDSRSTILIIHNYDGEDLGEFRQNLATYGAVKVRSDGDRRGGVESLSIEVNAENYKAILQLFKAALVENARSFDAKDQRMLADPNQMTIRSMMYDMDNDAQGLETEFTPALQSLVWFINQDLANRGKGVFDESDVDFIFNRDTLVNEGEVITNIKLSEGIISKRTQLEQHPWVEDVEEEMQRLEDEAERMYGDPFGGLFSGGLSYEEDARRGILAAPDGSGRGAGALDS